MSNFSNGKKVTEKENSQFLSLYTGLCDGGQSVLEHFCEDEDENSLNYRFEMLQKVIRPYVELVGQLILYVSYMFIMVIVIYLNDTSSAYILSASMLCSLPLILVQTSRMVTVLGKS